MEKCKLLSNKTKIAKVFSDFLKNYPHQLGINRDEDKFNDELVLSKNQTDLVIRKLKTHASLKSIRDNINLSDIFKFEIVLIDDILREFKISIVAKALLFKISQIIV